MDTALARHCSLVDERVFETPHTAIGTFRCPVEYPSFRDTGPIERCIVVFPRSTVWIRHEGSRAFLADQSVTTIYNRAQRYERFPHSLDGDRCDWFGVSDDIARDIVGSFDRNAAESERPFRFERAASSANVYVRQRALLRRALAGQLDALGGEESVIGIVAAVIADAYRVVAYGQSSTGRRHRDLVDAARAELSRTVSMNRSVNEIARAVGTSPYHLCRVFRAHTGQTLHRYRMTLRLRLALEQLESARATRNLSAIAHDLGFSSHSHFVRAMRRQTGRSPSALRTELRISGLA